MNFYFILLLLFVAFARSFVRSFLPALPRCGVNKFTLKSDGVARAALVYAPDRDTRKRKHIDASLGS